MKRIPLLHPRRGGALRRAGAAALLLALPASAGPPAAREATEATEERWFVLELDGRPAGWAVERWWSEDGTVVSESELTLRVARGAAGLEVELAGRFEESESGEPLLLRTRQALGSAPIETTYRFAPAGVEAESVQSGRRRSELLAPPDGEWLTPAQARREVAAHHAAGVREYSVRVLDPLEGLEPVTIRRTRLSSHDGAGRWREEASSAPGVVAIVELDPKGEVMTSTTELLGLEATLRRADRASALAARSGTGEVPEPPGPEVLVATLVRPDRAIAGSRRVREGVYDLSLTGGPLPDLPSAGAQHVERRGDRLRVTVRADLVEGEAPRRPRPVDADRAPGDPGPDPHRDPGLLASSLYLDYEDPAVRGLLEAAFPEDADPAPATPSTGGPDPGSPLARALTLTAFVHGYVAAKGLDTGFATASEVARSRRGDCTEHAVLLAALLRAAGIPSRAVTGLVYLDDFVGAEGVFGYHMWVQAHVEGRWVDLDPTLPWGFDATHIALAVSDLAGPAGGGALDRMVPLVGRLRIEVVEIRR